MRTARDAADSREEAPDRWERFQIAGFTGCVLSRYRLPGEAFARELLRLTDAAAAVKTLHWGRNYLYVARMETAAVFAQLFRRWPGVAAAAPAEWGSDGLLRGVAGLRVRW